MHELDTKLVDALRDAARLANHQDLRELILSDLMDYLNAASLSRGKDLSRSRYWAFKAITLQKKLRQKMRLPPIRD